MQVLLKGRLFTDEQITSVTIDNGRLFTDEQITSVTIDNTNLRIPSIKTSFLML